MTNAKEEFIEHVAGKQVLCAIIRTVAALRAGFDDSEYSAFLNALDFEYDSGYGSQELFGAIWYKDGTWSNRGEYDGSEWWQHRQVPKIPKECKRVRQTLRNRCKKQ